MLTLYSVSFFSQTGTTAKPTKLMIEYAITAFFISAYRHIKLKWIGVQQMLLLFGPKYYSILPWPVHRIGFSLEPIMAMLKETR
jgi:hypothetical protein